MEIRFSPTLVVLSILVAIFASYVALNLAHSVTQARGRAKLLWLTSGAVAMGVGIWSMHFIGMLAFEMPGMTIAYDIPLMILSVVVAIGASALALFIASHSTVSAPAIVAGGISMAAAIAGMHYIGMYSMRMDAVIKWNPFLVVLSVVIAFLASIGALFILMRLRNKTDRLMEMLTSGTVMGSAISGMHYTGMLAATFVHSKDAGVTSSNLVVSSGLTIGVISTTISILGLALMTSIGQRIWSLRNKEASESLVKSEEKFRHLVEAVKDYAIFMLDPAGNITTWNLGAERITGYKEKDILGRHVSEFYPVREAGVRIIAEELKAARETGHFETEGIHVKQDGQPYWASVVVAPLYNILGELTGFSKVIRDITHFKEAEARMRQMNEELENRVHSRTLALAQRESQLRIITNALPVLIAQLDKQEKFLFANEAFCKWFHENGQAVIGKTFREILGEHRYPDNEPYIKKALAGYQVTYERESRSGTNTAIFSVTFVPEFDESNQPCGFIVVAIDIKKEKEVQEELKRAKEAAEVANSTKSAFLANMSHEIRTPLGAVLGFSELLLAGDMTPEDQINSMEVIKRNGLLLSNIINDILDLSKVEAGKLEVERMDVSFDDLLKEIGAVLDLQASEKGIELMITSEGAIPTRIKTDSIRLRQILLNIVGNAIKFTQRGSVKVKVKMLGEPGKPSQLGFVVQDTGIGVEKDQVQKLFKPFTQADASMTRRFGGTGLGLVLSKKLANALGGDVVLNETTPGKGSTFTVTIDPGSTEQVLFQRSTPHPKNAATAKLRLVELEQKKILVVDDSPDNQALVKKILKVAGASVETANNGREAVERAAQGNFDIILMDLQMPEMDGYEAAQTLRLNGYEKPIIALTAHAMKEERLKSRKGGFDGHITKPIERESLIRALTEYSGF